MARPVKITYEQMLQARAWCYIWKAVPRRGQIAKRLGISASTLDKIIAQCKNQAEPSGLLSYFDEFLQQKYDPSNYKKVVITEEDANGAHT